MDMVEMLMSENKLNQAIAVPITIEAASRDSLMVLLVAKVMADT